MFGGYIYLPPLVQRITNVHFYMFLIFILHMFYIMTFFWVWRCESLHACTHYIYLHRSYSESQNHLGWKALKIKSNYQDDLLSPTTMPCIHIYIVFIDVKLETLFLISLHMYYLLKENSDKSLQYLNVHRCLNVEIPLITAGGYRVGQHRKTDSEVAGRLSLSGTLHKPRNHRHLPWDRNTVFENN